MNEDKIRAAFEEKTASIYEGDFAKYADGEYVSENQQHDYGMFKTGYEAAHKAKPVHTEKELVGIFGNILSGKDFTLRDLSDSDYCFELEKIIRALSDAGALNVKKKTDAKIY